MPGSEEHEIIVFRTYASRIEAELAKSALEASGILSMIKGQDFGAANPFRTPIRLMVRAEDLDAAQDVLGPDSTGNRQ